MVAEKPRPTLDQVRFSKEKIDDVLVVRGRRRGRSANAGRAARAAGAGRAAAAGGTAAAVLPAPPVVPAVPVVPAPPVVPAVPPHVPQSCGHDEQVSWWSQWLFPQNVRASDERSVTSFDVVLPVSSWVWSEQATRINPAPDTMDTRVPLRAIDSWFPPLEGRKHRRGVRRRPR